MVSWTFRGLVLGFWALVLVELSIFCYAPKVRMWSRASRLNQEAWSIVTAKSPQNQDLELALSYAREAVAVTEGKSAAILDTLAWVHFRLGQLDKAEEFANRALEVHPYRSSRTLLQEIQAKRTEQ